MRIQLLCALALGLALAGCNCGEGPAGTENQPPAARILDPQDGARLTGAGPFTLRGEATDAEDGDLPDAALKWSTALGGPLGTGRTLQVSLVPGVHRLVLEATDSGGLTASMEISVAVVNENQAPTAVIESPAEGSYFDEGQPIALKGRGTDAEDGALSGKALTWFSDKTGPIGSGSAVTFSGAPLGDQRVLLTATDNGGKSAQVAVNIHVVRPGTNRPPVVTVQSPTPGQQFKVGDAVKLEASATDQEDGALPSSAIEWSSSLDGKLGTGSPLTVSTLSKGTHTLTASAKDKLGAVGTKTVSIDVSSPTNASPVAKITAPATSSTVNLGSAVTFTGTGTDPEDGALSGTALVWTSSRDGNLGTGSPLTLSTLTAGTHQITLTATDSASNTGTATIQLTVLSANQPPTAKITSPQTGSTFNAGTAVQLRGNGTDPEDGALSGASLTWRSSLDGVLGTGASLDVSSLKVGQHTLTLTASDKLGQTGSASVSITIKTAPVKLPPVARLTGPTQGDTGTAQSFSGATSSDPDGTIASYRFDFGDGTTPVSGTSATATHTFANAGTFKVTLTVTDNDGLTATDQLSIVVSVAARVPTVVEQRTEHLGSTCQIGAQGGSVFVAFRAEDHPSLWLGTQTSTGWSSELVDGMGFNVGGQVQPRFAMAVDAAGNPHLAYALQGRGVFYATRSNGTWLREQVDTTVRANGTDSVGIALDPANGGRPTVVYVAMNSSNYDRVVVASRTGPGAFTQTTVTLPSSTTYQRLMGEPIFDPAGTLYFPTWLSATGQIVLGALANGTASALTLTTGTSTWSATAWRAPGELLLTTPQGVLNVSLANPLASSTMRQSLVETFSTNQQTVTANAGQPFVAVNHGSDLELVTSDANGYWTRESLGPTDSANIDAVIDGQGKARVCFFRAGKLLLY